MCVRHSGLQTSISLELVHQCLIEGILHKVGQVGIRLIEQFLAAM
jgi:hypothetical protein